MTLGHALDQNLVHRMRVDECLAGVMRGRYRHILLNPPISLRASTAPAPNRRAATPAPPLPEAAHST
ncbi:MAG: hypothetical protein JWN52_4236 [Actinomycetia bacterium]|nr:hypothetical protein [Actinomycetes bacterium]